MRDGLILLVDCTKPMFDVDDEDEDESLFQRCIRVNIVYSNIVLVLI